jgi:hypothetical protein
MFEAVSDLVVGFLQSTLNVVQINPLPFLAPSLLDHFKPILACLKILGRKKEARSSFERMVAWKPERVIMAHGRWYQRDGTGELRRAFRWVGSKE